MSDDEGRDEVEELLLVVEELEDAVILQDEELRLKDEEIHSLRSRVESLEAELGRAKSAIEAREGLSPSSSGDVEALLSRLRERDAAVDAARAENRLLHERNSLLESRIETLLLQQKIGSIETVTPDSPGPESDCVLRRSIPIEKSRPNSSSLSKYRFPHPPGAVSQLDGPHRRLDSKEIIILKNLRARKAAREAWVDSPVRREMQSNRESAFKVDVGDRSVEDNEPEAVEPTDAEAADEILEISR